MQLKKNLYQQLFKNIVVNYSQVAFIFLVKKGRSPVFRTLAKLNFPLQFGFEL